MRKTILLLINGFGVERKGSAEIYNASLMPGLDNMVKKYVFGNLTATAGDYNNGYRMFSMPDKAKDDDDEITNLVLEKKMNTVEGIQNVQNSFGAENNLHIFYIIEKEDKFIQVKDMIKTINASKDKHVFVHFVMTGTSTSNYDDVIKVISKVAFEMSDYCKIGMVVGKNKVNNDDFLRAYYKEQGEHWNESTKKFDILKREVINPEDAGVFIINGGYSLKENDSVFILNYNDIDLDRVYTDMTKIPLKVYSLYPYKDGVPNVFERQIKQSASFATTIEQFGIKILHLVDPTRLNDVNFYLNGMQKRKSPNISYATLDMSLFSSKENIVKLVDENPYDGIIIDFYMAGFNKIEDIKSYLKSIDTAIQNISAASSEKDYTFIVSSLFGMHSTVMDGVVQKVIDFSGKVPCIFQSNMFDRKEYSLNSGNTYSLAQTFLTNINDDVKANKLVHKLNNIEKMLSKK